MSCIVYTKNIQLCEFVIVLRIVCGTPRIMPMGTGKVCERGLMLLASDLDACKKFRRVSYIHSRKENIQKVEATASNLIGIMPKHRVYGYGQRVVGHTEPRLGL